ncbi:MAG: hypothetical protein H0V78_09215 [Burkholderiales bacterium]|nr:hypothetical protein [Burkholderiales bacterium]
MFAAALAVIGLHASGATHAETFASNHAKKLAHPATKHMLVPAGGLADAIMISAHKGAASSRAY